MIGPGLAAADSCIASGKEGLFMVHFCMAKDQSAQSAQSRRNFLRTVPLAAAAALPFTDRLLSASTNPAGAEQLGGTKAATSFKVITAATIQEDMKALQAAPGNKDMFLDATLPFQFVMTTETGKSAKEFEWHEGRDHIFQVLEGTTVYEVGGKPQNGRETKPGEWLAPASEGATTVTLHKGDTLVIPRGTPHKRNTPESVTVLLISPAGMLM